MTLPYTQRCFVAEIGDLLFFSFFFFPFSPIFFTVSEQNTLRLKTCCQEVDLVHEHTVCHHKRVIEMFSLHQWFVL